MVMTTMAMTMAAATTTTMARTAVIQAAAQAWGKTQHKKQHWQ